ncbi:DUF2339 domain-containing protein [Brachyspira sp.]|uniref:DUF2339 domain-containing protein n=1 Tax=Brachyspira sp. TaxID=1977261 RepID=UPI003D7F132F
MWFIIIIAFAIVIIYLLDKNAKISSDKEKQDKVIEKLEETNQKLISRFDALIEKMDSTKNADLQKENLQDETNLENIITPNKENMIQRLDELIEKVESSQAVETSSDKKTNAIIENVKSENLQLNSNTNESNNANNDRDKRIDAIIKKIESKKLQFSANINEPENDSENSNIEKNIDNLENSKNSLDLQMQQSPDLSEPKTNKNQKAPFDLASFERFLAQKVMIILGGIFFIIASFIFIKYSIDNNLFTPAIRITAAIIFGLILFSLGMTFDSLKNFKVAEEPEDSAEKSLFHKIERKIFQGFSMPTKFMKRIAQTCIGAGIVVEFFSVYGGYSLYGFFGEVISFALLCAISFGALFLTIRFGLIVGIFGLLGGFSTPILISAENPNFYLLCGYLFALHICVIYISYNRGYILPLLSSAFIFGYMWLFVERTGFITIGESIFAFIMCCVVFFALSILAMQIFEDRENKSKYKIINKVLFWIVSIFGFWVVFNISKPENIENAMYGFVFIVLICTMNLFAPFLIKIIESPKFARIFKVDESLKNPIIFDYSAIFSLILAVAYLLSFSRSLPNYCIIILETIFFIGFAARLFNGSKKLLYLSLLLITSVIFAAIEMIETTWIISNIASFVICIIIYAFIVAKDLEDSKLIRIILLLNTAVFFGAIFLLSENTNIIPRNEYYYLYLFCFMCFLAFLLLYALNDRIINFNGKSLRLRNIPDLAFIGFIFFVFSAIIFCDKCGLGLIFNLIGSPSYAFQHLEIYAIFTIMCAAILWFLRRFFSNKNSKYISENLSPYPSVIVTSFKDFMNFFLYFQRFIFCLISVLVIAFIGEICAKIYNALELEIIAFIDNSLYDIASATLFGICAIIIAKLYGQFSLKLENVSGNPIFYKETKIVFYIFGVKSLWLYLVALFGWMYIFFSQVNANSLDEFYWLRTVMISYCILSLLGFIAIFCLNGAIFKYKIIKQKFIRYCLDFIAFSLLICAILCLIHCAFGVEVDMDLRNLIYKFRINGANEIYAYSAGLVCISAALLIIGIAGKVERFKHYCFALLVIVALKVFFVDTSSFSSLGKVVLFIFMGAAFIGISIIYSKFVLKRD